MANKSIIRLDKVKGYPVSFYNSVANLENGQFIALKGLHTGDREAYAMEMATKASTGTIALHATVPVMYDERLLETDFALDVDKVGRAFILEKGDIVTINRPFIAGAVAVGDRLGIDANGKLAVAEESHIVEVIAIEKFSGQDSVVLQSI